jgi:hypothetical protein
VTDDLFLARAEGIEAEVLREGGEEQGGN